MSILLQKNKRPSKKSRLNVCISIYEHEPEQEPQSEGA
jgi:hypothetical protein